MLNSAENRNRWPGAFIGSHNVTVEEWPERFHSKNIPTAENKYAPENVSGWNDPKKDAILDDINSIITPERSEQLQIEFCKMFSDALPHLPLFFSPEVLVVKKGLTGITPRQESGGQNSSSGIRRLGIRLKITAVQVVQGSIVQRVRYGIRPTAEP